MGESVTLRKETDRVVKTVCEICQEKCGIVVHTKNSKVVKVEGMRKHPVNKGRLCIRASAAIELLYHPDRLKYPMKRIGEKGKGELARITWDEALNTVSGKLLDNRERYGPQSVVFYRGYVHGYTATFVNRLANAFGSPNFICESNVCSTAYRLAETLTLGQSARPDWEKSNYIIMWATNPLVSGGPWMATLIFAAKKRGAKIVAIDPRLTETGRRADLWIQVKPGTDGALALGMMNVIISEVLYDKYFVEKWTVGFSKLKELVEGYPPDKVEKITGVPSKIIIQVAREYAETKRAAIHTSIRALSHNTNGVYTHRALCCLIAITGHIDIPGGNIWSMRGPLKRKDLRLIELLPSNSPPAIGKDKFGLYCSTYGFGQGMVLADAILNEKPYPIKAFVEVQGNAMMWPNSNEFFKALKALDFHVVVNLFMTPSARYADIVLPATTFLERVGGSSGTDLFAFLPQPAVKPMYECWPDYKIIFELAKRMNLGQYFWDDIEKAIEEELEPSGISVQDLKANPDGISFSKPPMKYKKYEGRGFRTPSGKAELYSETLRKHGYDPLPVYIEPEESPGKRPELLKKYPLLLITGERTIVYIHSTLRNIPSMRRLYPNPLAKMNLHDATKRGIGDGDLVMIESARGSIKLTAKVTEAIRQGVVSIPHGWEEANANILTDDEHLDPISGFPPFNGVLCEVRKL